MAIGFGLEPYLRIYLLYRNTSGRGGSQWRTHEWMARWKIYGPVTVLLSSRGSNTIDFNACAYTKWEWAKWAK